MQPTISDRLAIRERPSGRPLMHQDWGKLLFLHWQIDEDSLRPLIPAPLEIDTFDGSAWIAIAPFTMWNISAFPPLLPRIPGLSAAHELNVRTYVHFNGVPGVWFFSLDLNSATGVFGARKFYYLPYFNAEIELKQAGNVIDYSLRRTDEPAASFSARWTIGEALPESEPGSLEFFLTERYCLYSYNDEKLYRARIHHEPWPLRRASLSSLRSSMIEAAGLPEPKGEPLLHYAEEVKVDVFWLEKV